MSSSCLVTRKSQIISLNMKWLPLYVHIAKEAMDLRWGVYDHFSFPSWLNINSISRNERQMRASKPLSFLPFQFSLRLKKLPTVGRRRRAMGGWTLWIITFRYYFGSIYDMELSYSPSESQLGNHLSCEHNSLSYVMHDNISRRVKHATQNEFEFSSNSPSRPLFTHSRVREKWLEPSFENRLNY
jgi:hypothetical protein